MHMTLKLRVMSVVLALVILGIAGYFAWQEYGPHEERGYPDFQKAEEDIPGFLRGRTESNLPTAPMGREE